MHSHKNNFTTPMHWKPWPPQSQNPSLAQGWQNPYGKYTQYPQFQQPYSSFPLPYFPQPTQPSQSQNPNQQLSLPFPQNPNKFPSQPLLNPNNKINKMLIMFRDKIFKLV